MKNKTTLIGTTKGTRLIRNTADTEKKRDRVQELLDQKKLAASSSAPAGPGASSGKDTGWDTASKLAALQRRLENAKAAEKAATSAVSRYAGAGNAHDPEEIGRLTREATTAVKARKSIEKEIERTEYLSKDRGQTYGDTFLGQFQANMQQARLSQDAAAAYSEYLNDPTEENRAYAKALDQLLLQFQEDNTAALDDEGAVLPWITKSAAGYLPQLWDQTKAQVGGALAGGAIGAGAGSVIPGVGTVALGIKGAKAGAVAGSGVYSYSQMQGAAFKELLAAGIDEETARAAAKDEAVISALIEMADTGFDIVTLGTGKLLSALGKGGTKAIAGETAESAAKRFAKGLAGYGLNVGGEMLEEGTQQAVSIANRNRNETGALDLAGDTAQTLRNAVTGKNREAAVEIWESAKEGGKIAAMFGGATRATNAAVGAGIRAYGGTKTNTNQEAAQTAEQEIRKNEAAAQSATVDLSKYPNLQKIVNGDWNIDPAAVAAEAAEAINNGDLQYEDGRQLARQAAAVSRDAARTELTAEQAAPAAELKSPGFYGEASRTDSKYLDRLAKAAGVSIERVSAAEAGNRDGWIIGGRTYISENNEAPLRMVAKHEVTHYLQEMAGEAYGEFRSYVENIYREGGYLDLRIQEVQRKYRDNGKALTAEEALDELAADYAGELMDNEALIRRLAGENRNLGQRVLDAIRDVLRRLKTALGGEEVKELDRAAKLWEQALQETNIAYYQEGRRAAEGMERNLYAGTSARTADIGSLWTAERMEEIGRSVEDIRQQTGWFRGMDGKWRFEIDDSGMRYDRQGIPRNVDEARKRELTDKFLQRTISQEELSELQGLEQATRGMTRPDKLSDYIDHPALFEAYPELRDTALRFDAFDAGTKGQYDRRTNTITLSQELRSAPESTLIHEIQHAIQSAEGFTGGSSVGYWTDRQSAGFTKGRNDEAIRAADEKYREIFEGAPEEAKEQIRAINRARLAEDWDTMIALEEEIYAGPYADLYTELGDADFDRRSLRERNEPMTARELYENTAGEIEARDAAKRRTFTAQQRQETAPELGDENTVFADGESIYQDAVIRDYHTEEQRKVIREYNAAVDTDLLDYVEGIIEQPETYAPDYRMGEATHRAVDEVLRLTGVDTTGFDTIVKKTDIEHILKRHGANGQHDRSMSDPEDIARIKYVLDNYDAVELGDGPTKAVRDKNNKPAQKIVFSKKINGTYYVVEAVADNKARATRVISAYMSKDGDAQVTDVQAPVRTSDNGPASAPFGDAQVTSVRASGLTSDNEPVSTPKTRVAQENGNGKEKNSVKGARELQKQIDRLERQNKRLQEQMKLTNVPKANRQAVEKQAGELRKAYGSRINKVELADRMEKLYAGMAALSGNGSLWEIGRAPSWEEVRAEARSIADDILAESRGNINPMYGELADLRKDLRGRKISLFQEYRADLESVGGYNELRKRSMGSFTLSNDGTPVDMVYQELSDQHPDLFPDDIIHPADQLVRISEVAQNLKAVEGNPFERELEHTAAYLAGEIEERFYDTPQEKPTKADKMARRYHEQRIKDQQLNAAKLYNQQKAHEREIRDMETRYREENRRRIENQTTSQRRETIRRHAERLGRKLARPTDKQHVPDEMRGAALALVTYLDTGSNYELAYGPDAKYHRVQLGTELGAEITSRTAAARELQAAYRELAEDPSLTIDPDMDDYLDDIARMGNKRIADMTRAELDTVWKVMQVVEHTIRQADDMLAESRYRTVSAMAEALRKENGGRKDRVEWAGSIGAVDSLLNLDMLTPETFFSRLGEAGTDIFRQMRRAADRQTSILKEGTDRARKLIEESGVSFKKADKELRTFEVSGGEITLSKSQIMELYALSKREQAMEHIYKGGLKPVEAVHKGRVLGGAKPVKVTPGDVAEMVSTLSDKEKLLVDGLQKYLSTDLSQYGNEESRKVYGYDKFKERNYWPIKVSSTEVASDPTKAAGAKTIPGYGMTKALTPKANNAVELRSAIDTFSSHLNQMATYAAWLGTNENVTRLHNFKYQTEDGQKDGTVKEIFEKVYGKNGSKYLENLLSDIAQGTKAGADHSFAEQGLARFKAAKVGGNLRVIIQQPTAILRAMEMVDPTYFISAKNPLKGWEKAKEYSGIAQWKDWGYFEMDTGRSLRELMTGTENNLDKAKNSLMAPAGAADSVAWGHLWNAVEAETAAKHPELEKGSRAFYEATAERFGEVVDRTQVVDSVLHRTQIMRSSNYANKVATSFMSEPSKVYNMVVRDLYDFRRADSDTARKKAGKQMARSTAALITSFAVNALAQSLVDGLRDDDREKEYWDKVADNWGANFTQNFNPLGYIPYAKDVVSLVQGYTLDRSDMEGIADAVNGMRQFFKATAGESQKTVLAAGLDAASKLGDMIGLPVSNLKRDAEAIFRTVMNGIGAGQLLYKVDKLKYNPETAMSTFQNDLYRAMDSDWATYEMIYSDIMEELQEQGLTEEDAADKIRSAVESRMKKSLGVESVSSLPVRYSAPGEDEDFNRMMQEAAESEDGWLGVLPEGSVELALELDDMDEDTTDLERIREIGQSPWGDDIKESALMGILSDSAYERYESMRKGGLSLLEWSEAYVAIKEARIERTGESGSESQADVIAALEGSRLSNKKKSAVWDSYGWKKESPWG